MAIQNRRGAFADFDPTKMVAGEFAVVQTGDPNADDGKAVYMAFSVGSVKRLATYEDMQQSIVDATEDVAEDLTNQIETEIASSVTQAETAATNAAASASAAAESARTLTIDSTLTHTGQAADAKKTGDEIDGIKEDLNIVLDYTTIVKPDGGDAYQYVSFPITSGHKYTIKNNSSATINVHSFTQASSSGEQVETLATAIAPNGSANKQATLNASAVRVYFYQGFGSVTIVDNDSKYLYVFGELPNKVNKDGVGEITERNTTFFIESPNLINLNTVIDGYRINQSGSDVYEDEGRSTTDYIDVSEIDYVQYYYFPNGVKTATTFYYVLYNASKVALTNRASTSDNVDVQSASYIRISFTTAQRETASLVDTSATYTEYKAYGYTFKYADNDSVEISPSDDVIKCLLDNAGKSILFKDGTYDIIAIYKAKYGDDYFDNYTGYASGGNNVGRGLPVLRKTKIRATEGAVFVAEYTGTNAEVRKSFSAFAVESGVELDGINVTTIGIRNAIHDDFDNNYSGKTTIKNCKLVSDNKVIAGGFAQHDHVEISNCYIRCTASGVTADFSYHNNATAGAQSQIVIKDNYLYNGVSLRYYGASTLKSLAMVSNNSMANEVEYIPENSSATIDNIDVLAWNNEIRT